MKYTAKEQKQHRDEWVAALRSGKYKQGQNVLRRQEDTYCCLGVACDLSGVGKWVNSGSYNYLYETREGNLRSTIGSREVRDYFGLSTSLGEYARNKDSNIVIFDESLASQNDGGKSFAEIADIIEAEPDGLLTADAMLWYVEEKA